MFKFKSLLITALLSSTMLLGACSDFMGCGCGSSYSCGKSCDCTNGRG